MKKLFIRPLLFVIAVLGVHAQLYGKPLKITITAGTKSTKLVDEVAASTIIINEQDIQQSGATDVAQVLEQYVGFDVVQSGSLGQQTSVFTRGAESNHTLLIIDGVKINSAVDGAATWNFINTGNIKKIEVIKGPRSTLYGSDAIGAVVSIETKKGVQDGDNYYINVEAGELNTRKFSAGTNIGTEKLYFGFDTDFIETDGIPARTTSIEDHPHDNASIGFKVGGELGKGNAQFNVSQIQGNTAYQGFPTTLDQDNEISTVRLSYDLPLTVTSDLSIILSSIENKLEQNQENFLSQFDFSNSKRNSMDIQLDTQLNESNLLVYGLLVDNQSVDVRSFGTEFDEDINNTELFLQDEILFSNNSRLYIGGRIIDNENFDNRHEVGNIEYIYPFNSNTSLSVAYGTAFKAPTGLDLFGFGGNVNLQPEESESAEVKFHHTFNDKHSIQAAVFSNSIRNLINTELVSNNGTPAIFFDDVFQNQNVQKASNEGIEIDYRFKQGHWLFDLGLIKQDPKNDTANSQLLRRAKESYKATMRYDNEVYYTRLNIQKVNRRIDVGNVSLDSYFLADIKAGWRFNKNFEVYARVDNISDENYVLANTFNTLGRTTYLGLSYTK